MPRTAKPWFRAERNMWFYTTGGKQIPLEVRGQQNEHLAHAAVAKLLAAAEELKQLGATPPVAGATPNVAPALTVADLVPQYLSSRVGISPRCLKNYGLNLKRFCESAGTLTPPTVTAGHVERAADRPGWSPSTKHNFVGDVTTFLKWCGVAVAPKKPRKRSRGAKAVLTPDQFATVLADARTPRGRNKGVDDLAAYLEVLWETGARPQEVAQLRAEEVDWDNALVRREDHHKTEETCARVIHFTAAAMAVLRTQRGKWVSGFLFRTRYRKPFRRLEVVRRLLLISGRVGFKVYAYMCRHSWATRALIAGVPDTVVAALLGHKGTAMLHKGYSHVGENAKVLAAAAERVSKAG